MVAVIGFFYFYWRNKDKKGTLLNHEPLILFSFKKNDTPILFTILSTRFSSKRHFYLTSDNIKTVFLILRDKAVNTINGFVCHTNIVHKSSVHTVFSF